MAWSLMMMRMGSLLVATLAIGCAPASVAGTVGGAGFAAQDAISTAKSSEGTIWIGTKVGLCDRVSNNQFPANSQDLFISVFDVDASGQKSAPTGPGTYVVNPHPFESPGASHLALVTAVALDASCSAGTHHEVAVDGTVTLTRAAGGSYAGSFDLRLNDHVTGTFDAAACSDLATFEAVNPPNCMP